MPSPIDEHDVRDLRGLQSEAREILKTREEHHIPPSDGVVFLGIIPDTVDSTRANAWFVRAKSILRRLFGEKSDFYASLASVQQPTDFSDFSKAAAILDGAVAEADSMMSRQQIAQSRSEPKRDGSGSKKVFIVHGHDDTLKVSVARFVERLGFSTIVLHEQANAGKTIIEKFEENADSAAFAIVLLTPDDVGAKAGAAPSLSPRARQNVIFEHGFFIAALGRKRVVALKAGGVEIPSDLSGVIYIESSGPWQLELGREMKAAGLDVDLNKAV